jgi:hypothetical protein
MVAEVFVKKDYLVSKEVDLQKFIGIILSRENM